MKTLLKFEADWCGPCKQVEPVVKDVMAEHDGQVELKTIDVDKPENQAIVREHGIRAVPTFVLKQGDEVLNTYQGTISRSDLTLFINGEMDDTNIPLVARSI